MPATDDAQPARASADPVVGDVLGGRYRILGELGRGGMATVYRGQDLRLHRRVAIKVFRGAFGDPVDPRRTTQEMRLLARVDHPSVVSVLDASTGDGTSGAFLVMELVDGDDLGALLHRARGALSADFARRIVADVAGALDALHRQGVVHRDVKPANILVPTTATGGTGGVSAKLTDFGIAQLVDGARITGPESVLGTAAYLSPEQVRGSAPQPPSDVYSLGLVLLEALTGRRAFPGSSAESAVARLHRRPALPDGASPDLADLLSRMTAMDPAQRPTAEDVAAVLRDQLAGRVTAPDAAVTARTPIVGVPAPPAAAPADPDATRALEPSWPLSRGMPIVTGAQPAAVPAPAPRRRRAPAVLAAIASVMAAGVAVAAVSAASSTDVPGTGPTTASPARSTRAAASGGTASKAVLERAPVAATRTATTTSRPTPTETAPRPTASRPPASSPAPEPGVPSDGPSTVVWPTPPAAAAPSAPEPPPASAPAPPPEEPAPSGSPAPPDGGTDGGGPPTEVVPAG